MNEVTTEELVDVVELRGEEYLFYPAFPINVALFYFLSSTRYSKNAFFRRQVGTHFEEARLRHQIYANFSEAQSAGLDSR